MCLVCRGRFDAATGRDHRCKFRACGGGTLCNAATALLENGAAKVSAYITHGVLSGKAVDKINASDLSSLVITDTICATEAVSASSKIREISIAPMFAKAITRIANGESVSVLFE